MNKDAHQQPKQTFDIVPETAESPPIERRPRINKFFVLFLFVVFGVVFTGISVMIGIRMWWNSPIHPSFAMFGAVTFASVIAFTIVLSLDIVTGSDLSFEFAGLRFTGTSGPVTLWVLTFAAIMTAFITGSFKELSLVDAPPRPAIHCLWPNWLPSACPGHTSSPTKK
jgi:hypothetical protein